MYLCLVVEAVCLSSSSVWISPSSSCSCMRSPLLSLWHNLSISLSSDLQTNNIHIYLKVMLNACIILFSLIGKSITCDSPLGHVNIGLSSDMLEIPNDAYTTLSQNLIGCLTRGQENCKLMGWYWIIMGKQLWRLSCRILHQEGCINKTSNALHEHLSLWSSMVNSVLSPSSGL